MVPKKNTVLPFSPWADSSGPKATVFGRVSYSASFWLAHNQRQEGPVSEFRARRIASQYTHFTGSTLTNDSPCGGPRLRLSTSCLPSGTRGWRHLFSCPSSTDPPCRLARPFLPSPWRVDRRLHHRLLEPWAKRSATCSRLTIERLIGFPPKTPPGSRIRKKRPRRP